jgi:CIC family chloride channel protein
MQTASQLLPADLSVREAWEQVRSSPVQSWLLTDQRGVVGAVNSAQLENALAEGADKKVGELVDPLIFPHVHADQGLDMALERMGANQLEILPVVNRGNIHKLEGIVTLRDVLDAYGVNRA